jgi:hypothetical protein
MGNGRIDLTRGASVVVPADFVGGHTENALPPVGHFVHWVSFESRPCRWFDINTADGVFDWSGLDARVAALGGMAWTYTVWGTPTWASARPGEAHPYRAGCAAEPADMTKLGAFVTALVTRYPTLTNIEVWNEPDIDSATHTYFWYSGTVAKFVEMATTTRTAAKAVRPAVNIIGPGSVNYLSAPNWLDAVWAAGLDAQLDGISFHAYQMQWGTPYKALLGIAHNSQYMTSSRSRAGLGNSKPRYITEFGQINPTAVDTPDAALIAGYQRAMVAAAALGYRYAAWYTFDGPVFAYQGRRAVEQAVRDMAAFLPGKTLTDTYIEVPEMRVHATVNGSPYSW